MNVPQIPNSLIQSPQAIPPVVPVTQNIGTPIVNLPGCVEAHPDAGKSKTLAQDDENSSPSSSLSAKEDASPLIK